MNASELVYERPPGAEATEPPEASGRRRDDVRLLVSRPSGHTHARFTDLPSFLRAGDLLVVNDSATLPASLRAEGPAGPFLLNAATRYGRDLWLAEARWDVSRPGPLPIAPGDRARVCSGSVRFLAPYPGTRRLWFVEGDLTAAMTRCGEAIRYRYVHERQPLSAYQTIFAAAPGSAEMPSAARPFTREVVDEVRARGIGLATITLHAGVSSLDVQTERVEDHPIPPEPFHVSAAAAAAVNATRRAGGRVIAVGTTVVRALESAWRDGAAEAASGFTRVVITPERGVHAVDGLLTGLHDPGASHLAMLHAIGGRTMVRGAYDELVRAGYRWHEFGDSHLLLPA